VVRALLLGWALLVLDACTGEPVAPDTAWLRDPDATILVGAGDIGVCDDPADELTAALLDDIPGTIFTAGDNAYPDGAYDDFVRCYEPGWGRHKARTRPAVGNHEYRTSGAADYFRYFGDRAGPPGLGYYSYELGEWHIVVLNSEIAMEAESAQGRWLADDLAASDAACVLAYWHRPLFSSGAEHGGSTRSRPAWDLLYAAGADVVLNGHEHIYERFAPQSPDGRDDPDHGIRQFIVGTGGADEYDLGPPRPQSEVRSSGNAGVLALRLLPDGYEWRFVSVPGSFVSDTGCGTCHRAPPAASAPAGGGP
jgi:hypothetical protein